MPDPETKAAQILDGAFAKLFDVYRDEWKNENFANVLSTLQSFHSI